MNTITRTADKQQLWLDLVEARYTNVNGGDDYFTFIAEYPVMRFSTPSRPRSSLARSSRLCRPRSIC